MEKHFVLMDNGIEKYKKAIFFFAGVGFLAGVFLANTFCRKMLMNLGVFGDYFFMQVENITIESNAMLLRVFEKRMLFVMLVVVAAVVSQGIVINYVVSGWMGLSLGLLLSAAAMQNGIEGMSMCLVGLLPHYLLYIPAGLMLMLKSCQLSNRLHGKEQRYQNSIKSDMTAYLGKCIVIFIVFLAGILLESFLNPIFLQKIYKIFNNI